MESHPNLVMIAWGASKDYLLNARRWDSPHSVGSGLAVPSKDGEVVYIITSAHVIDPNSSTPYAGIPTSASQPTKGEFIGFFFGEKDGRGRAPVIFNYNKNKHLIATHPGYHPGRFFWEDFVSTEGTVYHQADLAVIRLERRSYPIDGLDEDIHIVDEPVFPSAVSQWKSVIFSAGDKGKLRSAGITKGERFTASDFFSSPVGGFGATIEPTSGFLVGNVAEYPQTTYSSTNDSSACVDVPNRQLTYGDSGGPLFFMQGHVTWVAGIAYAINGYSLSVYNQDLATMIDSKRQEVPNGMEVGKYRTLQQPSLNKVPLLELALSLQPASNVAVVSSIFLRLDNNSLWCKGAKRESCQPIRPWLLEHLSGTVASEDS